MCPPSVGWLNRYLNKVIIKVNTNRDKAKMKFGVMVLTTVEAAMMFDAENGDTLWQDAINKEMANSRIAFEVLEEGDRPPVGYTEITCHLIFDVIMDLTRKTRYVAGVT